MFAGIALVATAGFSGEGNVRRSAKHLPGRYIVALESNADPVAVANDVRNYKGGKVAKQYRKGFSGLSVELSDADAVALSRDARVQFIEEDATVSAAAVPWGLDRIDQRALPLNTTYVSGGSGAGVTAYVLDTGIASTHADFGGRVAAGFNAFDTGSSEDCNGHGTHVAGVIGGANFGVAKSVTLVPVRVLDCTGMGSTSTILAGIDWILDQPARPAVVNMSLGGDPSAAVDNAVKRLLNANIPVVVAAGNSNGDACASSPARVPDAITVGASDQNDQRASFSNYGACVDLFAPGSNIVSDWYSSSTATAVSSGTSAATPFTAGVVALALQKYPSASPAAITQTLLSEATIDALGGVAVGTPNRLLFSLLDAVDTTIQSDSQLLADPGFEYGSTFWTWDICTVINPAGCPSDNNGIGFGWGIGDFNLLSVSSHSGKSKASLGGSKSAQSFHLVSEAVTIPASARRAEMGAYVMIVTKGNSKKASDYLRFEVRDRNGKLLDTIATYSNLDDSPNYVQRRIDVSKYRGSTIRLSFTADQSNGPPTWFFLDDVSLNIWR